MGLRGHGFVSNIDLADKEVCEGVAGNNCGVCIREADIQIFNRNREGRGLWCVNKVAGPRTQTHTGAEGGRLKERIVSIVK